MINKIVALQYTGTEAIKSLNNIAFYKKQNSKTKQDSFIKSAEPSLTPDVYTKQEITNANTAKVANDEPLELTQK